MLPYSSLTSARVENPRFHSPSARSLKWNFQDLSSGIASPNSTKSEEFEAVGIRRKFPGFRGDSRFAGVMRDSEPMEPKNRNSEARVWLAGIASSVSISNALTAILSNVSLPCFIACLRFLVPLSQGGRRAFCGRGF
jgi:hypothetical protein